MTDIAGRTAFVTGGGAGIGRGIALALAAEGAAVAIADILPDNAARVAAEVEAAGGRAVAITCDVIERASIAAAKAEAEAALGPVSLLFANAGATALDPLDEMTEADIDWIVHVNLMGVVNCVGAFYPAMAERGDGHLYATASIAGLLPDSMAFHAPYSGAKLGIVGFMLNLAIEAHGRGVGVTVCCPGGVDTRLGEDNGLYRPARFGGPRAGPVKMPAGFVFDHAAHRVRPAGEVGRMILQAVREDRRLIVTDGAVREQFRQGYVRMVEEAFDFVDRFDAG